MVLAQQMLRWKEVAVAEMQRNGVKTQKENLDVVAVCGLQVVQEEVDQRDRREVVVNVEIH